MNAAIAELVAQLNDRTSRHLGASRRALFEALDRPALKPLPAEPYVFAAWKECRVGLDYHVEIDKHYYSAPHGLLREKVWARIIPARAGNASSAVLPDSFRRAVHPRACGERTATGTNGIELQRFIPARAGNAPPSMVTAPKLRFIPARAGERRPRQR